MSTSWIEWATPIVKRLVEVENQVLRFTDTQNHTQRALSIALSSASIAMCLLSIYTFLAIDPRRLVFRHQLIAFLILFDLLKAIILLLFPVRVLTHATAYYNNRFCQTVGFFTATAIEGADIAILAFAVHTFLLIFRPQLTVKVLTGDRMEGGLYLYRYYVYGLSFLIPLVLASLPYVDKGYIAFVCWCYLPQHPVWYRLVLSWVPRYCIVVIIFLVYIFIYVYVLREFRTLGGVFTTMHRNHRGLHPSSLNQRPSFFLSLKYFWDTFKEWVLPELVLPEKTLGSTTSSSLDPIVSDHNKHDAEAAAGDQDIQAANLDGFRKRQRAIEKQMKSIFVYPFAYIFVWLFPFILQCTQFNYESAHLPIYWLNCMGAFMQPFNGVVDSAVFFFRERPWEYTVMKHFEREHAGRLDLLRHPNSLTSQVPGKDSAITLHVDTAHYLSWRHWLSALRLPLFQLPTNESAERLLRTMMATTAAEDSPEFSVLLGKHDFSNLLSDTGSADHRPNLRHFSFSGHHSFGGSASDLRPSMLSVSGRSHLHRVQSPIPEGHAYVPGTARSTVSGQPDDDSELDLLDFLRKGPTSRKTLS